MIITLTLNVFARSRRGSEMGTGPVTQYRVGGMPRGQEASIANFGSRHLDRWQILLVNGDVDTGWSGDYKSADDALAVLKREFS